MPTLIPSPPYSLTFDPLTSQELTWNLFDEANQPIAGATVTATFFINRDKFQPFLFPGTADPNFTNIAMPESSNPGTYIGDIPATFNPAPAISGYIVVITAVDSGNNPLAVFEIPAVVSYPQNDIDLVTVDDVKAWLQIPLSNSSCDRVIQLIITSFSQYVLNKTGRASFKKVLQYTEVYDGNGQSRLFLNQSPINTLVSVQIGTYGVPQSPAITYPGVFIEQQQKSIAFRASGFSLSAPLSIYPYAFTRGIGNVQVVYTAGYSSVPYDLQEVVIETVAQQHKRADWIDLASKAMSAPGGSGSTVYRSWALTPMTVEVLDNYSRYARP